MIRAERDYYRWRRRFALWPRKIGKQWIWLEWFAWRPLKTVDVAAILNEQCLLGPLRPSWWTEFTIKRSGYTAWRESIMPMAMCAPCHIWHRPRTKPELVQAGSI